MTSTATQSVHVVKSPTIAIIGMEGAGKTVLTTTLAKRLSTIDSRGVFLNPQGVATLQYVEKVWATLQSEEWPPSTPLGELFELKWKLQIVGETECDVRLIDVAGQDLRLLFGEERIHDCDSLPDSLKAVADYCRSADIVLFLINLEDFIGEGNDEQRAANEAAIKSAMDYLSADGGRRSVALVFTQADQYRHSAEEKGGWLELAAEAIPYVFGAHINAREIAVHAVSAVNDTRVSVTDEGVPRRVPVKNFSSEGLDSLVDWLTQHVQERSRELQDQTQQPKPNTSLVSKSHRSEIPAANPQINPMVIGVCAVLFLLLIVFLRGCDRGDGPNTATLPSPEFIEKFYSPNPGFFVDGVIVYGTIRNNGSPGKIRVIAQVKEENVLVETQSRDFYLGSGQTADFRFQMNKIRSLKNDYKVFAEFKVPNSEGD